MRQYPAVGRCGRLRSDPATVCSEHVPEIDEKRLLRAVAEDLSSDPRTAEHDLTDWDEGDTEILARTGPDPELAGLAEHAVAHTVLPVEKSS